MRRPKLDAATWAQLNQLLDSALDQPASAWDRWVDLLGPEHAALKPRLRELLGRAADRDYPSFLEFFQSSTPIWRTSPTWRSTAIGQGTRSGLTDWSASWAAAVWESSGWLNEATASSIDLSH